MVIRPLCRADGGPLLQMWNASARFDPLAPGLLDEKIWGDPDFNGELALVSEEGGRLTGFAMGVLRRKDEGPCGVIKLQAVAADRRREGVGSRLLLAVERRLRDEGAATARLCESVPNYLTPGVDSRYTSAPYFFEKHGYRRVGESCNMTVDLEGRSFDTAEAKAELAGRGIEIRRATGSDRDGVMALLDAFWPSWRHEVGNSLEIDPCTLHLALQEGAVIGFAVFDGNNRGTGWFGPMGTAPAARKQGIGQLLLFRCLADIAAQGHRYATIPWVGPVEFYSLCAGAAVSRIFDRYEKVLSA